MTDKTPTVQDVFLTFLRGNQTPVTIYLLSGVQLKGIITWFDPTSLLLRREAHAQLVYKHAISTIVPGLPVQIFEGQEFKSLSETNP